MKSRLLFSGICVFSLVLFLFSGTASAQSPNTASFSVTEYPFWLEIEWDSFRNALSLGNKDAASEIIVKARKKGRPSGIFRFDSFSAVLIEEGEKALKKKDFEKALTLGQFSLDWSPGFPRASFFLARAHFKNSPINIFLPVKHLLRGVSSVFRDFWQTYYLLGSGFLIISAGALAAFLYFTAHIFFRSLPLITHSFYEWGIISKFGYWGILMLLVLLPFFTGWGLGLSLLVFIVLCWSFSTRSEKVFQGIFVLLVSTAVFWLPLAFSLFISGLSGDIQVIAHSIDGQAGSPRSVGNNKTAGSTEKKFDLILSRALVNERLEKFDTALADYSSAQKIRPDYFLIDNNKGNIYFKTQRLNQAISSYNAAVEKNPEALIPFFNLHLVYSDLFKFDKAAQSFERAQQIDSKKTQFLSDQGGGVVDEILDRTILWKRVFSKWGFKTEQAAQLFGILFFPLQLSQSFYLLGGFVFGITVFGVIFNRSHISQPCGMCQKPICFQCQRHLFDLKVCKICWTSSRNIKRKGDLRELRVQRKKRRRKAGILSLVLPGSGHILYKKTFKGLFFAASFLALIFVVLFKDWLLQPPGASGGISGLWLAPFSIFGLLVVYLLVFLDMRKFQTEEGV